MSEVINGPVTAEMDGDFVVFLRPGPGARPVVAPRTPTRRNASRSRR
jgi:hypothetical protein